MHITIKTLLMLPFIVHCQWTTKKKAPATDTSNTPDFGLAGYLTNQKSFLVRDRIHMQPALLLAKKASHILDLNAGDEAFSLLKDFRYLLGEVDYGSGMVIDRTWDAAKIGRYAYAVLPICQTKQALMGLESPSDYAAFLAAAYGRQASAEENKMIADFQNTDLPEERRKVLYCMAVLTSTSFLSH